MKWSNDDEMVKCQRMDVYFVTTKWSNADLMVKRWPRARWPAARAAATTTTPNPAGAAAARPLRRRRPAPWRGGGGGGDHHAAWAPTIAPTNWLNAHELVKRPQTGQTRRPSRGVGVAAAGLDPVHDVGEAVDLAVHLPARTNK